jgi:hypothetical protein
MKKYPDHLPAIDALKETADTLEFPVTSGFASLPPSLDPQAMLRRIEENMLWKNSQPGVKERRLAEKIPAEFVL